MYSSIDTVNDYTTDYATDNVNDIVNDNVTDSDSEDLMNKKEQIKNDLDELKQTRKSKGSIGAEQRRMHWNEYMRNYRARKKREQNQAIVNPKHIPFEYNGRRILCDCNVIRNLLLRYTHLLITLYNLNINSFDDETTEALNANNDDFITFSKILVGAFEELVNQSPLTSSQLC